MTPLPASTPDAVLREAVTPGDLDVARALFREYADMLGVPLDFQGFEEELASLPGRYAAPGGAILLAFAGTSPVGCVALRPLDEPGVCEMKRMFVRPAHQGRGLGRVLAGRILADARARGYRVMRLDTLERLAPAVKLYESLGFRRIEPYGYNPLDGVLYFEAEL